MSRFASLLLVTLLGCTETHTVSEPDGAVPPRRDGGTDPGRDAGPPIDRKCDVAAPVDVLFVIDDSASMAEEQASLGAQLPAFVRELMDPPDLDMDGERDWLPVPDLHLGVVTTDMGTGGFAVPTCSEPELGDDGVLRTAGNTSIPGCMATYPPFLTARPGSDPSVVAGDLRCVAQADAVGCGFEQPLEAMLKALTPSTAPITFQLGTRGQGDRANAGFVRDDSLLAIVHLTDEEDCSAADPELFNPSSGVYTGNLNLRCFQNPEAVHPVDRYVEGLLRLRAGRPDLIVHAAITGVPTDLVDDPTSLDYDAILADERMQERVDPAEPTNLVPSCSVPGFGSALPARRMVGVARDLERAGAHATVQSICQADFGPAVAAITARIGRNACARFLE